MWLVWIRRVALVHCFLECFRVNVGDQAIRVSSNLPPGYLQHEQLGLGKGVSTCTEGGGIWLVCYRGVSFLAVSLSNRITLYIYIYDFIATKSWMTYNSKFKKNIAYNTLWIRYNYVNEWEYSIELQKKWELRKWILKKKLTKNCDSKKTLKLNTCLLNRNSWARLYNRKNMHHV